MKKRSKFIGKCYGNWVVISAYLRANYSGCTAHNAYAYTLSRRCSTGDSDKLITVCGNTMTKIDKGLVDVETVANNKKIKDSNSVSYIFY